MPSEQSILIATLYSAIGIGFVCDLLHENEYKRATAITRQRMARFRVYTVTFADGASYETFGSDTD